jgi:hypothetical protein
VRRNAQHLSRRPAGEPLADDGLIGSSLEEHFPFIVLVGHGAPPQDGMIAVISQVEPWLIGAAARLAHSAAFATGGVAERRSE